MIGKGKLVYALILGTTILVSGYSFVKADSNSTATQGTANDPLVTKSYVDSLLKGGSVTGGQAQQQPAGLTEDQVKQLIADQLKTTTPATGSTSSASVDAAANLTVVQLQSGQTLYANAGAELIVRTGKTVAVSIDENGIPDVTAGKDISAGASIDNNHLLIFPREGRGIKPAPKNTQDIYVMVRGTYTLMNDDDSKTPPDNK
jgi:hypothetical protein